MDAENKLLQIFTNEQLASLRKEYKGTGNTEDNKKPKLQILASFVVNNYKCSGPDKAPICLYDYTVLNTLNDYFVFSVPTANLPTENHYHKKEVKHGEQNKTE